MVEAAGSGLTARGIMTTDVAVASPGQAVDDAAWELTRRQISGMPVVSDTGAVVGVVSEYDIITKRGKTVADIMSRSVISVSEEATAAHVAGIMGLHGIRLVPVLRDGKLVGIISRSDMVRLFATVRWHCPSCGNVERGFSRPERCGQCGETALQLERELPVG